MRVTYCRVINTIAYLTPQSLASRTAMQLAVLNLGANRRRGQGSRDLLPVDQGCLISRGVSRTTRALAAKVR